MLTTEKMAENKKRFLELVASISRPGDKASLVNWLSTKSDFFIAPASTKYHNAYAGGLCEHSLLVYDNLVKLNKTFTSPETIEEETDPKTGQVVFAKYVVKPKYSDDTLKLVGLFHDMAKGNYYEQYSRNVKGDDGKWKAVSDYKIKDADKRFIFGNHEENSEFMITSFFNLTVEESSAILHHHGGMGWDSAKDDVSTIFSVYNLALLLHMADMLACYIN